MKRISGLLCSSVRPCLHSYCFFLYSACLLVVFLISQTIEEEFFYLVPSSFVFLLSLFIYILSVLVLFHSTVALGAHTGSLQLKKTHAETKHEQNEEKITANLTTRAKNLEKMFFLICLCFVCLCAFAEVAVPGPPSHSLLCSLAEAFCPKWYTYMYIYVGVYLYIYIF